MKLISVFNLIIVAAALCSTADSHAQELGVAAELEAVGGHALGLAGGGSAALDDVSAVRLNPAMLASSRVYQMSGSYLWPEAGRPFFQLGVVDGTSKNVSAGILYTGAGDDPSNPNKQIEDENKYDELFEANYDSRFKRKVTVGLASVFGKVSAGVSVGQVSGFIQNESERGFEETTAVTMGVGVGALVTNDIRVGASLEGLNNKGVEDLAPRFQRIGAAYLAAGGEISVHADYVERQRTAAEVTPFDSGIVNRQIAVFEYEDEEKERLGVLSATTVVQNMLRLSLGAGAEVGTGERIQIAGGFAILSDKYTLSYHVAKPYIDRDELRQSAALSLNLVMK